MPPPPRADVQLLPLGPEHASRMAQWVADPVVADGLGLRDRSPTLEKTLAWIERTGSDPAVRAFALLAAGTHVGTVTLDRIDDYLGTARLSVYVGVGARGSGVGRAAVARAAGVAFSRLGLHKLWLTVHAENARAIAAYLAVGFSLEGILRDEFLLSGRRVPALYMGLLRSEYEARQGVGGD